MNNPEDDLTSRRVVLLRDIVKSKTLPITELTLRRRMAEQGIPEVQLGPRKRGMRLADLDTFISNCTQK